MIDHDPGAPDVCPSWELIASRGDSVELIAARLADCGAEARAELYGALVDVFEEVGAPDLLDEAWRAKVAPLLDATLRGRAEAMWRDLNVTTH
jgi:hypothetical protein